MANPEKPTASVRAVMAKTRLDVLPTTSKNTASIPKPIRTKRRKRFTGEIESMRKEEEEREDRN